MKSAALEWAGGESEEFSRTSVRSLLLSSLDGPPYPPPYPLAFPKPAEPASGGGMYARPAGGENEEFVSFTNRTAAGAGAVGGAQGVLPAVSAAVSGKSDGYSADCGVGPLENIFATRRRPDHAKSAAAGTDIRGRFRGGLGEKGDGHNTGRVSASVRELTLRKCKIHQSRQRGETS